MDELRDSLVEFVKRKFSSYPNIHALAEDIVQEAYLRLYSSAAYTPDKENFGYLSVACARIAYRQFLAQEQAIHQLCLDGGYSVVIREKDFVAEIMAHEDTRAILRSLDTLRKIERVVITQRYYGDLSFSEIAEKNNLNLNTVLSHHRRALAKLRPQLTRQLGLKRGNYDE